MAKADRGTHTSIPWLSWTKFIVRTTESCCVNASHKRAYATDVDYWTAEYIGGKNPPGHGNAYWGGQLFGQAGEKGWHPIFIPQGEYWDILSEEGIWPWSIGVYFSCAMTIDSEYDTMTGASARVMINNSFTSTGYGEEEINWDRVSGKYFDGENEWDDYPQKGTAQGDGVQEPGEYGKLKVSWADCPREYMAWTSAWDTGYGGCQTKNGREQLFKNGCIFEAINYDPGLDSDDYVKLIWTPLQAKMYFLNAVVNSLNKYKFSAAGGETLRMYGLAYDILDEHLGSYAENPGGSYSHSLYEVWLESVDGKYTYEINKGDVAAGIVSNTQATIPMPAMEPGYYWIKLRTREMEQPDDEMYSYAGDWRTAANGRAYKSERIVIQVGEVDVPKEPPVPYWRWKWKWGDLEIWEYYAPIDVRSNEIFWDGRVLSMSTATRAIDDFTGMYSIGDANVTLANNDLHFSKLLANYFCKNQIVEISHGRGEEAPSWHSMVFTGIVDDYTLAGEVFSANLKDFSQRYLKKELPRFIVTTEEFPNAHQNAIGRAFNEVLGMHSLTTGDAPGALEAHCIDTTTYKYGMAGGPLHSIPQVYSDGTLISSSNYTTGFDDLGRQIITFNSDQGNNRITFNCTGYYFEDWNSDNGYVQNPAYILAFYLSLLCDVPINFLDMDSFDELAQIFETAGWHESGKLAIVGTALADGPWQELLYSFGVKYWQTMDGRFKVGRKDISNLTYTHTFLAQTDMKELPTRPFNLNTAINSAKANWDYIPAADVYLGSKEGEDPSSINLFGSRFGPQQPWLFKWIDNDEFAAQRITEDILKLAFGEKTVNFTIPLDYIDQIDIFDNFKMHDPYGLSTTGAGETGRWYYVTSLQYNYQEQSIKVEGVDLQWLLQQYFIFGDEDQMPDTWDLAGDTYRLYGYMCDENTDAFSDGSPGKILIDENLIEED